MLTLPITYTNFNNLPTTRNFYFNLTEAELTFRQLSSDGQFSEMLETLKTSQKGSEVFPTFQELIKWTYGEKSEDGESFVKSDAAWARFENSEPWSVLMMRLIGEEGFAAYFINSVIPASLKARVDAQNATNGFRPGANTSRPTPPQQTIVTTEQPFSAPAQPVQTPQPQQAPSAPIYQEPAQPTESETSRNEQPIVPNGYTEGAAGDIRKQSAPRDWTPPGPQQ